MSIRRLEQQDSDIFFLWITAVLKNCAKTYCGAVKTEESVFEEMAVFVLDRFGMYGVAEIELAFSLAAAKELCDVDLQAYYGQFSVAALGGVLSAYRDYRNRVARELRLAQSNSDVLALPAKTFSPERYMQEMLSFWLEKEDLTIKDFTFIHYKLLVEDHPMYVPTKAEKLEVWDLSKDAVNLALASEAMKDKEARRLVNWFDNPDFKERQIRWSKCEVLRRWVVGLREVALLIDRNVPQKEQLEHQTA